MTDNDVIRGDEEQDGEKMVCWLLGLYNMARVVRSSFPS